jgi:hypothetical protein
MPRVPIDPRLGGAPFSVRAGAAAGHSRQRLAGPDLMRPYRGVRSAVEASGAQGYAPLLRPGDRFSHTTAAELWGAPLPRRLEGQVHVSGAGARARTAGAIGHESPAASVLRGGLPASSPELTFFELAGILTLDELIAVGDHLVLDPHQLDPFDLRPYTTLDRLGGALDRRRRHIRRARAALEQVREGVESPMETVLRLLIVRAGLPEPICGYEVARVGWFDLAWPRHMVLAEYDGDQHRTSRRQYERDIERYDGAADLGWRVIRVRHAGVTRHEERTVERIRRALSR